MKINYYHIRAVLFVSAAFIAKSAYSETNNVANRIDLSGFYREWAVSPSNALEQIKVPLMALAASAKTNAADQVVLHNSLWGLFSTNTIIKNGYHLHVEKCELIANAFRESGEFSTPQEARIFSLAKTLGFLRNSKAPNLPIPLEFIDQNAYDAMSQELKEKGAYKQAGPILLSGPGAGLSDSKTLPRLIWPSSSDPEELVHAFRRFWSLIIDLSYAQSAAYKALNDSIWRVKWAPKKERESLLAKLASLEFLEPDELAGFEDNLFSRPEGFIDE